MPSGFQNITRAPASAGLLLLTNPREFFTGGPPETHGAWRHLLLGSLAAAVLGGFSFDFSRTVVGVAVLFVNAVGMTCIFAGSIFMFLGVITGRKLPIGAVFPICAWASLGPILISWIPGSVWVGEPWRWWVTVIGLSAAVPCSRKRAAGVIVCAVGLMYGLFWAMLSGM